MKATYASGGLVQRFATGGTVPAMVSSGEAFVPPGVAKSIGYSKLEKMNQADRNGMTGFAGGGISVFKGPGTGTSDSIGPIGLPEGSFVIREKATKALGLASGGVVQKFNTGGSPQSMTLGQQIADRSNVLAKLEAAQAAAEANFMKVAESLEKIDQSLIAGDVSNKNYQQVIDQKVKLEQKVLKAEQEYEAITRQVTTVSKQRADLLAKPIAEKQTRRAEQSLKADESRANMQRYRDRETKRENVNAAYADAAQRAGQTPEDFNRGLRKRLIAGVS